MILLIKRLYYTYQIEKVKRLYRNNEYNKALLVLNKIKFRNKSYFFILKSALLFFLNKYEDSLENIEKALVAINQESIYNEDEYMYLKAYSLSLSALIYKNLQNKDLSYKALEKYNLCRNFNRYNIRDYLLEEFPLDD